MPRSKLDNFAFDMDDARNSIVKGILDENRANAIPILDESGAFTGETYDQRDEQPQDQPSPKRFQDYIDLMASQGQQLRPGQAPQATGFEAFNPIDPFESEGVGDAFKNVSKASLNESAIGMVFELVANEKIFPEMSQWSPSELEEFSVGIGSLIADTPLFLAGGGIGGVAGKQLTKGMVRQVIASAGGKEILKSQGKKTFLKALRRSIKSVPTSAGAFGAHSGTVDALQQQLQTGSVDLGQVLGKTAEGAALGAVVGPVGAAIPTKLAGSKILGKAAGITGEIGAFGTAMPIIQEGRSPEKKDYVEAAKFILGMQLFHGVIKAPFKLKDVLKKSREIEARVESKDKIRTVDEKVAVLRENMESARDGVFDAKESAKAFEKGLAEQKQTRQSAKSGVDLKADLKAKEEKAKVELRKEEIKTAPVETKVTGKPAEKSAEILAKDAKEAEQLRKSPKGAELLKRDLEGKEAEPLKAEVEVLDKGFKDATVDKVEVNVQKIADKNNVKFQGKFPADSDFAVRQKKGSKLGQTYTFTLKEKGKETTLQVPVKGFSEKVLQDAVQSKLETFKTPTIDKPLPKQLTPETTKSVQPKDLSAEKKAQQLTSQEKLINKPQPKVDKIKKTLEHKSTDKGLNKEVFGKHNPDVKVSILTTKSKKQVIRIDKASSIAEVGAVKIHADKLGINVYVSEKMIKSDRPTVKALIETGRLEKTKSGKGKFIVVDKPKDGKFERIVTDSNKFLKDC